MNSCRWECEALVAALRARGVRYLAPSDARLGLEPISDRQLQHTAQQAIDALADRLTQQLVEDLCAYAGGEWFGHDPRSGR